MSWEWKTISRGENKHPRKENKSKGFKAGETVFFHFGCSYNAWGAPVLENSNTYHVHVNAVGVSPCVLEIFFKPLPQRVGDLVKANELFYSTIHPSIHPSIHPPTHLPIHLFILLTIHPSIHPPIHSSKHPSIHPSIHSLLPENTYRCFSLQGTALSPGPQEAHTLQERWYVQQQGPKRETGNSPLNCWSQHYWAGSQPELRF